MAKSKSIKKKTEKEKRIQICSVCGSPDIENDFSNPAAIAGGFMAVKKCNNCSYRGTFFPSIPISKLRKPKKRSEVQVKEDVFEKTYVSGVIGFWKLSGIALILLGIILLFIPKLWVMAILFSLPLGILTAFYGFLYNKFKDKLLMKVIMILIIIYFIFGGLFSLSYI